jgi:hypothetical protein
MQATLGVAVIAASLTAAACAGGAPTTVRTAADEVALAEVIPAAVGAGPSGGWIVTRTDVDGSDRSLIIEVARSGEARSRARLPQLNAPVAVGTSDGVAVAGVACSDECEQTVAVVHLLNASGGEVTTVEVDRHDGPVGDTDSLGLVGRDDHATWYLDFDGELVPVRDDGSLGERVPPGGDPCVVRGGLYSLLQEGAMRSGESQAVGIDPTKPMQAMFQILRWEDGAWREVDGGTYRTGATAPTGRCSGGAFIVQSGEEVLARWSSEDGWRQQPGARRPTDARSNARSSTGRPFVLAGDGVVWTIGSEGWEPTSLDFEAPPTVGPPVVLSVGDHEGGTLFGCVGSSEVPTTCEFGRDQ